MNNPKLQQFLESFASSQENQEKLNDLVKLSFGALELMQKQFTATNEDEKKAALEELMACSQELNTRFDKICHEGGMTREEMQAFAEDMQNFSPEQWAQMQAVRSGIEHKAAEVIAEKPRKAKAQWIAG